jgi:hypothetical protein
MEPAADTAERDAAQLLLAARPLVAAGRVVSIIIQGSARLKSLKRRVANEAAQGEGQTFLGGGDAAGGTMGTVWEKGYTSCLYEGWLRLKHQVTSAQECTSDCHVLLLLVLCYCRCDQTPSVTLRDQRR